MKIISNFKTVGELKKLLEQLPDDAEVFCELKDASFVFDSETKALLFTDKYGEEGKITDIDDLKSSSYQHWIIGAGFVVEKYQIDTNTGNAILVNDDVLNRLREEDYEEPDNENPITTKPEPVRDFINDVSLDYWPGKRPFTIYIFSPETEKYMTEKMQDYSNDSIYVDFAVSDFYEEGNDYHFHLYYQIKRESFDFTDEILEEGILFPSDCYLHRKTVEAIAEFINRISSMYSFNRKDGMNDLA